MSNARRVSSRSGDPRGRAVAVLLLACCCNPAHAQIVVGPEGGSAVGRETAMPSPRRLDDSDPEMRALLESFFDKTPCAAGHGICLEALAILTGGSDRLATYLIHQIEESRREGSPYGGPYLRLLGHTESRTAFDYLRDLTERSGGGHDYLFVLEGLGRTRDLGVVDLVVPLLLDPATGADVRRRCVNALVRVESKHGPLPKVREAFAEYGERSVLNRGLADRYSNEVDPAAIATSDPGASCRRTPREAYALHVAPGIREIRCRTVQRERASEAAWVLRWDDYHLVFGDATGDYIGGDGHGGPYESRGADADR